MTSEGSCDHATTRAFGATSTSEEQQAFIGRVHCALAAKLRWNSLVGDLMDALRRGASKELLANWEVMKSAAEAFGLEVTPSGSESPAETLEGVRSRLLTLLDSFKTTAPEAGTADTQTPIRAFDAFSFAEEKHAVVGNARLQLAADIGKANSCQKRHYVLTQEMQAASNAIHSDKEAMIAALEADGIELSNCSLELRADPDAVLAAVSSEDDRALGQASWDLRSDRDFVAKAVKVSPFAFEHASENLRGDQDIALAAASDLPSMFRYASIELRGNREVALAVLKEQTRLWIGEGLCDDGDDILQHLSAALCADKEIVLEAVKVNADAWQYASVGLRKNKDFLLHVMRTAQQKDQQLCYDQAAARVRSTPFREFQAASDSAIALSGETAPVLNITLTTASPAKKRRRKKTKSTIITSCEVSLLSGATFSCSLHNDAAGSDGAVDVPGQPPTCSTLGHLADLLRAELPKHVKLDPVPARVFIVFDKGDSSGDATPVTPWDWNRPLSDFL